MYHTHPRNLSFSLFKKDGNTYAKLKFPFASKDFYKKVFMEIRWDPHESIWYAPLFGEAKARNTNCLLYYSNKANPFCEMAVDVLTSVDAWEHQKRVHKHQLSRCQSVTAAEPRTGKTKPTLKAVEDFLRANGSRTAEAVWVSTKSGVISTKRELAKWYPDGFPFKLHLLTYDKFTSLWPYAFMSPVPKAVVFDEFHLLKSPDSNRGRACRDVYPALDEAHGGKFLLVGMSGTPSPKDPTDWWNLCETICPGYIPEKSKQLLMERLAVTVEGENEYGQTYRKLDSWRDYAIVQFAEELKPLVLTITKADVMDLPEKQHVYVELEPEPETTRAVEILIGQGLSGLKLINRLSQISDGFIYEKTLGNHEDMEENERDGVFSRKTNVLNSPKMERLKEDMLTAEANENYRLTVFAAYGASINMIVETAVKEGWAVLRADARGWKTFNTLLNADQMLTCFDRSMQGDAIAKLHSETKMILVANAKTASTGIELSMCPVVIYYGHSDNGEAEFQSLERAHSNNMDKEKGLTVLHYCHLPTDKKVIESLVLKKNLQELTMGQIFNLKDVSND